MSQHLKNGQIFPELKIPAVGGGTLSLPGDLAGSYGVILIYRGHWCPFCNEQMAAFANAFEALSQAGIKVVAFSVDDEAATAEFVQKHHIPFKMGHSANVETVVSATGAYDMQFPTRGHFLETTGFVLAPDGSIVNAVYSSRAIGRLVPSDVIRLVAFMKSLKK
jgi:peroxiredoxin